MQPLIIYHKNCADGFGAAWVAHKVFPDAEFFAATYGESPPDCADRDIYILDFSYKCDVLNELAWNNKSVTILDHHKSAAEDLVGNIADNVKVVFDMERSGAMITWDYFFPDKEPPALVKYIQDRDLWQFELDDSKAYNEAVFSFPYTMADYDDMASLPVPVMISWGASILRKKKKDIEEFLAAATQRMTIIGYDVPVVNCPYMWGSDACAILAVGQPFAAYYWDSLGYRNYGLRSAPDGIDVSKIAAHFGGGGHEHAAGFRVLMSSEYATKELASA